MFCYRFDICCGERGIRWESHGCVEPSNNSYALGGIPMLDLFMHMMAFRFLLLQDMGSYSQHWISIA